MSKHTPGPWIFEEAIGDAETGETIWYTVESENGELIAGWCKKDDAALMAASLDLKDLLKNLAISGPDQDGFFWLKLQCQDGTNLAFNLGKLDQWFTEKLIGFKNWRDVVMNKAEGETK